MRSFYRYKPSKYIRMVFWFLGVYTAAHHSLQQYKQPSNTCTGMYYSK